MGEIWLVLALHFAAVVALGWFITSRFFLEGTMRLAERVTSPTLRFLLRSPLTHAVHASNAGSRLGRAHLRAMLGSPSVTFAAPVALHFAAALVLLVALLGPLALVLVPVAWLGVRLVLATRERAEGDVRQPKPPVRHE